MRFNYQNSTLRICVDRASMECFSGKILGPRLKSAIEFDDINDFILQIDSIMDQQSFPKAFMQIRSFTKKALPNVPVVTEDPPMHAEQPNECGLAATFLLNINSRQNASWQGRVDWLDGSPAQSFDSSLRLVNLIADRLQL